MIVEPIGDVVGGGGFLGDFFEYLIDDIFNVFLRKGDLVFPGLGGL